MESSRGKKDDRDSWHGVLDPRKRKQIQDRLAQRARRKRLSAATSGKDTAQSVVALHGSDNNNTSPEAARGINLDSSQLDMDLNITAAPSVTLPSSSSSYLSMPTEAPGATTPPSISAVSSSMTLTAPLPSDHLLHPESKISAILALSINGHILGLTCSDSKLIRSRPQPPNIPESLYPTPLQLSIAHHDWIDRFPFPRMRDNMIALIDVVDFKDLLFDFFTMPSFTVNTGAVAWDPGAWRISPEFKEKWGYLFC
ncbi:hypothetical protein A1O1_03377 [Capronia coronata CBS 617.96]|uniref:BZIP domain-containing protein n=1 Tax=Capronia coronata CBS 617.96 TaxID=1182541 RepID=W9YCM8_9EURO|nr:uncharacterized protein A1O1_03377 [Capronia coronata CBS 617.96]EXJ90278.1 hypothetical protein A1O1_03377 [Capronia coronata CBS 617.96]